MPVINPIWFYLISVCDAVKTLAIGALMLGACCLLALFMVGCGFIDELEWGKLLPITKKVSIAVAIVICVAIFCPSQKTIEKMLVAQNVTYERVEQATDVVSNVYEDIMNLFDKDDE